MDAIAGLAGDWLGTIGRWLETNQAVSIGTLLLATGTFGLAVAAVVQAKASRRMAEDARQQLQIAVRPYLTVRQKIFGGDAYMLVESSPDPIRQTNAKQFTFGPIPQTEADRVAIEYSGRIMTRGDLFVWSPNAKILVRNDGNGIADRISYRVIAGDSFCSGKYDVPTLIPREERTIELEDPYAELNTQKNELVRQGQKPTVAKFFSRMDLEFAYYDILGNRRTSTVKADYDRASIPDAQPLTETDVPIVRFRVAAIGHDPST